MSKRDVAMSILLTREERKMLEAIAARQRRSMNQVIGLSIERMHQAMQQTRIAAASGIASGQAFKPPS